MRIFATQTYKKLAKQSWSFQRQRCLLSLSGRKAVITKQQVAQWTALQKPKANIGLRCDQALMVDIDIEVPAEAQRMTELFPRRYGATR